MGRALSFGAMMGEKFLATFPCYVMYIPDLAHNPSSHALHSSPTINFVVKFEDSSQSLMAFSNLDLCASFVADFPDSRAYGILPVADGETLAKILLNLKARKGVGPDVRFDPSKSFDGHWVAFESAASGGTDDPPDLEV
jgi:hypothetical protein